MGALRKRAVFCIAAAALILVLAAVPEQVEWFVGLTGLAAALVAAYYGSRALGGIVGKALLFYSVGVLVLGLAAVLCVFFYLAGVEESFGKIIIFAEDILRTASLCIFAFAAYTLYRETRVEKKRN